MTESAGRLRPSGVGTARSTPASRKWKNSLTRKPARPRKPAEPRSSTKKKLMVNCFSTKKPVMQLSFKLACQNSEPKYLVFHAPGCTSRYALNITSRFKFGRNPAARSTLLIRNGQSQQPTTSTRRWQSCSQGSTCWSFKCGGSRISNPPCKRTVSRQ